MTISPTYEMLIVWLTLIGIGVAGLRASRRNKGKTTVEYFFAGRNVGWLALGLSLFVTTLWSIWSIAVGLSASGDISAWVITGTVASLGLLSLGVVFAPLFRKTDASTIPRYLGERFSKRVGAGVAVVLIFLTLLVRIPLTILVGTQLLHLLLGWDLMASALLMIVVPGVLVVAGGYKAVMAAQGAGGIAAAVGLIFLASSGYHLSASFAQGMPTHADIVQWPMLAGVLVLGAWYTCFDQFVVQRAFAGRSCATVRGGTGLAAGLVFLGVAALAMGSDLGASAANTSHAGNPIMAGFVGAGIISFGIASLAGHFMTVATIFTLDLLPAQRKVDGEPALVLAGRLTNTVVVILALLAASSVVFAGGWSIEWMAYCFTVAVPPLVAVLAIGLLWPRMHGRGAAWALALGWIVGIIQAFVTPQGIEGMIQNATVTFVSSAFVFVAVSLIFPPLGSLHHASPTGLVKELEGRRP